jgi:magnesium-transporting ATPase (P-type)
MIRRKAKIIYRASPTQKLMFISALRESGNFSAITGSNIEDV